MKKKNLMIALSLVTLSSCAYWSSTRKPAMISDSSDLTEKSEIILSKVATREINPETCQSEFDGLIKDYSELPAKLDIDMVKADGQRVLDKSFEARLALHSMLDVLPVDCKKQLRELYLKMRLVEDLVGIYYYDIPQISADTIDYQKEPVPVYEKDKYQPYHVAPGIDPKAKFEFRNGDIMITMGKSFVSSTIVELATPKSVLSHIVLVHVDEKTKVVSTIESYVGKGVSIFPIDEALKNENVRILVLRPKDAELANKAANYMYDKVTKLSKENKVILYDYNLDFSDNSTLSCEEVAYDAFKQMSDGKMVIPEIESQILLDDAKFLKRVGVKKGPMMVPTDMETDPRFDIVLDWTDYRVLRDSWRKSAVLGEMLRWVQEYDYRIYENLTSIGAKAIWSTRFIPGVWPILAKLAGIPKDFTKDVPSLTISTMASLQSIATPLLAVVTKADQEAYTRTGRWLTKEELYKVLDDYRKTNPKKLRKVFREK